MITRRLTALGIEVEDPMTVLILGSVGLFLNIISLLFLHGKCGLRTWPRRWHHFLTMRIVDHDHGHGHGHSHSHSHDHTHAHDDERLPGGTGVAPHDHHHGSDDSVSHSVLSWIVS